MTWEIIDTGVASAEENMRFDAELLDSMHPDDAPLIHFYEWERPSITYGHFVDPGKFIKLHMVKEIGLDVAKRSTGGGIVFHPFDFAFSLLIPANFPQFSINTLENYQFVNGAVLEAIQRFEEDRSTLLIGEDTEPLDLPSERFCMARPTKYDVIRKGRKLAGAAQRRKSQGLLHHGMIALLSADEELLKASLIEGTRVLEGMRAFTQPLLSEKEDVKLAKQKLKQLIYTVLKGENSDGKEDSD